MIRDGEKPGILPLENRIRAGWVFILLFMRWVTEMDVVWVSSPRPSTCRSVRIEFLAVTPSVHSIDTLALTDVISGYAKVRGIYFTCIHYFFS